MGVYGAVADEVQIVRVMVNSDAFAWAVMAYVESSVGSGLYEWRYLTYSTNPQGRGLWRGDTQIVGTDDLVWSSRRAVVRAICNDLGIENPVYAPIIDNPIYAPIDNARPPLWYRYVPGEAS